MKKAWRIIIAIVLVAILLGSICVGVGLITGGDINRVITALDERYHPAIYYDYVVEVVKTLGNAIFSLGS